MAYYPPNSPHWQQPQKQPIRIGKPVIIAASAVAVLAVLILIVSNFGVKIPAYQLGQTTEYTKGERTGLAYRVTVDPSCSDDQLHVVFSRVTRDDHAEMHTVWFWSSSQLMIEGYGYDVAVITDESGSAVLDRK